MEKPKNKKDKCVSCDTETQYDEFDHIDSRYFYIEGCGQLCYDCFNEIYLKKNERIQQVKKRSACVSESYLS